MTDPVRYLPPPHPATLSEEELWKQVELDRVRSSGPGGQRRNKVETGVVLRHIPSDVRANATERRSPEENRQKALRRLRLNLAVAVRTEAGDLEAAVEPSLLWRSRIQQERIVCNPTHHDYPALLAEALDVVSRYGFDVKFAAGWLGCTFSQLLKFIGDEPAALVWLNRQRALRQLPVLRLGQ